MSSQVPQAGELTVDHIAHFVPDIGAAGAALEALGFTLTPFSEQSHRLSAGGPLVPAGTGNRCVMLERGYLEILTPTADTPVANQLRAAIQRYPGIHLIAFGSAAPDLDHARLEKLAYEPLTPVALQRPIPTVSGEETARFTVVRVPPGKMPEGRIQFCQHHTPELLWQRRWVEHRNGAVGLSGVLLCVEDPDETAQRYGAYTGLPPTSDGPARHIQTARGTLTFVDPATLARVLGLSAPALPWIAGYALESRDLDATRAAVRGAAGSVIKMPGNRFAVALPLALGGAAIFEQPGSGVLRW
jgi:hypothetical protein